MAVDAVDLPETVDWHGATVRWGRLGQGPPVVLCHGTPWSSVVWRDVAAVLAAGRSVYLWDMVGYGQSDKPDGDVSLGAQARLLASLVRGWGLDAPDVVAHDYGGAVALRAHLLHGVAVRSLALVDVVTLRPWGSPFFRLVREHSSVFEALPPHLHEALVRAYVGSASAGGLREDVLDALVSPWLGDGQAAFYRQVAQADEQFTAEVEDRYATVSVPTLVVWGTADEWIPVDRAHRLHAAIPGSRLHLVEGAGHLVQEDRPAQLAVALDRWLAAVDGRRGAA